MFKAIHTQAELEAFALDVARRTYRACARAEGFYQTPDMHPDWDVSLAAVTDKAIQAHNAGATLAIRRDG